jgi:hypothetical protein
MKHWTWIPDWTVITTLSLLIVAILALAAKLVGSIRITTQTQTAQR